MVSQALISGTMASRYQGSPATGAPCALAGGRWKPSTIAPPTAVAEARKSRRLIFAFEALRVVALMWPSRLGLQLRRSMDRRADARIGAAAADVGHCAVDLGIGRLRLVFEESDRRHDLPRLTVSALGHVELDPGQLDRMRPISREPLDRGDALVGDGG